MFPIFDQRLGCLRLLLLLLAALCALCAAPPTTENQSPLYTIGNKNATTRNNVATTATSSSVKSNIATISSNNNLCASSNFLNLQPVPSSCRHYVLCYRRQVLRLLPCPDGTAFSARKLACLQEQYLPCLMKDVQKLVKTTLSCSSDLLTFYPDYSQGCPSTSFYRCHGRQLTKHDCPRGTVFDEGVDACLPSSQGISCATSGPVCPEKLRDVAIYADYSQGCPASTFTLCSPGGGTVIASCPKGLYYNGAIKNCDYPQEVVCASNVPLGFG